MMKFIVGAWGLEIAQSAYNDYANEYLLVNNELSWDAASASC